MASGRLRPPAGALGLFAARRRDQGRGHRPAGRQGRACRRWASPIAPICSAPWNSRSLTKDAGVQPIVGCALPVSGIGGARPSAGRASRRSCCSRRTRPAGAISACCRRPPFWTSRRALRRRCPGRQVAAHAEGLILLSGGTDGPVDPLFAAGRVGRGPRRARRDGAGVRRPVLRRAAAPRAGQPGRRRAASGRLRLRQRRPAGRDQRRLVRQAAMWRAHDALLCIADGAFVDQEDRRRVTAEHWFKSARDMRALFADLPEACDNTLEIARRCAFMVKKRDPILPRFPTEGGRTRGGGTRRPGPRRACKRAAGQRRAGGRGERLLGAAGARDRRHPVDGLLRLLPDRLGLHEVVGGARHPGGAGAGLRRRLAGGLVAADHRHRPDPLRPASSSAS